MTYTPPPYQPPQGPLGLDYSRPAGPGLRSARGAAVMMWIIAALLLLYGSGFVAMAELGGWDAMFKYAQQSSPELAAQMNAQGQTPEQMRLGSLAWGGIGIVIAVAFIILGLFVFRGRIGAIITSIVLTSLVLLGNLCVTGSMAIMTPKIGPAGVAGSCFTLIPLVVFGVLLYLLVNSAKGGAKLAQIQQQRHQAEMWQLQQQPQASPGGYGYGSISKSPDSSAPPQQSLGELPTPPAKPTAADEPPK